MSDRLPFPEPPPYVPAWKMTRTDDPATSHQAARAMTAQRLTDIQQDVMAFFQSHGPATDEWLIASLKGKYPVDSTVRSRRADLVELGLIRDSGRTSLNRNGRQMIIWELV